jgi:hypothetical protein
MTLDCPQCEARVAAEERGEYQARSGGFADGPAIRDRYVLFSCPACEHPFLVVSRAEEEVGPDEWTGPDWKVLFPGGGFELRGVPDTIALSYGEAAVCFRAGASTAAAVMCRRALEAICKDKGVTKRNLAANLKALQDQGTIDARLYEWADALRIVGNDAAHNVDEFMSKEDAKDGLDFTRAIIEYVYTFTDAFEKFKARRASQKASQKAASGGDSSSDEPS